jgi:hypothetical protein
LLNIEAEYLQRMDALPAKERIARSAAMFQWHRECLSRQILAESGPLSSQRLKWEVALRQYGGHQQVRDLIARILADVCR